MQIVIDIDENVFTRLFDNGIQDNEIAIDDICEMAKAIRKGKPFPKRHGDLKDMGNLKYVFDLTRDDPIYSGKDIERAIKSMTSIIEADKAEGRDMPVGLLNQSLEDAIDCS